MIPLHGVTQWGCTCPQREGCASQGKHPRIPGWQRAASTDEGVIRGWWMAHGSGTNVGVVAGQSGLAIIDIDGAAGESSWRALLERAGGAPDTAVVRTGRGFHAYFLSPELELRPSVGSGDTAGLDVRAGASYVVAPPSVHASGAVYEWARDVPCAPLPQPVAVALTLAGRVAARARVAGDGERIPAGQRDKALASFAGSMRRRGMTAGEIEAGLAAMNAGRCDPPLDSRDVHRIAWSVGRYEPSDPHVRDLEAGRVDVDLARSDRDVLLSRAGFTVLDVARILAAPVPATDWLWHGLIEVGELAWLSGLGKTGKSMVALRVALAALMAREGPAGVAGVEVSPVENVVYLDAENRPATIARRLHGASITARMVGALTYATLSGADLGTELGLEALAESTSAGGLLILDSLVGLHRVDENSAGEVRAFVDGLRRVAKASNLTVIGLAHENRGGNIRGSLDWRNAVDRTLTLVRDPDTLIRTLSCLDVRDGPEGGHRVQFRFHQNHEGLQLSAVTQQWEPDQQQQ